MSIGMNRSSFGQNSASHNRAGKAKVLLCAIALGFGVSFGWTPSVPDTILLPDSLGPLRPGYHLAFGSSTNNIYVASESSDIIVVDGNTFQRVRRIYTGPVGGAVLVNEHNRLYCSFPQQGRIGVIDCATNNVVGSIQVGTRPTLLCYSSGSDKLYCGDAVDRTVSVIDCAINGVLKVIPVGDSLAAMEYDPTTGKVYAATYDAVRAISCSADSVVASIDEIKGARSLRMNKRRQKLYALAGSHGETTCVVSTSADSVIATRSWVWDVEPRLACNEATDRLYAVGNGYYVYEFDCSGDTGARQVDLWPYVAPVAVACDTVHNRLYCLSDQGTIVELDGTTLDYVSVTFTEGGPGLLESDPVRHMLLCACGSSLAAVLSVFDHKSDSTYARGAIPLCGWKQVMCHNPAAGKLYCRWGSSLGGLGVVDEQTNRVIAQSFLSETRGYRGMTYSRTSNKFYFWTYHGLGVIDGAGDSLLERIDIGDCDWNPFACWCPDQNKVYCFASAGARYYIAAIDCGTDSVMRTIDVYDLAKGFEYLGGGRMLCILREALILVDCRTDSVLADSAIGAVHTLTHTGDGEKTYIVRNRWLEVRSSSSLAPLTRIDWPYFDPVNLMETFLVYSDTTRKLYWFAGDSVLAIDAASDTVTARLKSALWGNRACLDHSGRYLFCSTYYDSTLRVYDTKEDSLVALYRELPHPVAVIANPEQQCIYVGCRDVVLVYPDAPPGVEEQQLQAPPSYKPQASVIRSVLFLPQATSHKPQAACLMDAAGRRVMVLRPGANDVRGRAPGVYFLRGPKTEDGRPDATVRKIVITR